MPPEQNTTTTQTYYSPDGRPGISLPVMIIWMSGHMKDILYLQAVVEDFVRHPIPLVRP